MNISDDILLYGESEEKHNNNLKAVLERLREKGLTLNRVKCELNKGTVEYFSHVQQIFLQTQRNLMSSYKCYLQAHRASYVVKGKGGGLQSSYLRERTQRTLHFYPLVIGPLSIFHHHSYTSFFLSLAPGCLLC